MSTKLQGYLSDLQKLQKLIENEISASKINKYINIHRVKMFPSPDHCKTSEEWHVEIYDWFNAMPSPEDHPYYLLTLTFDSAISYSLDEYGQKQRLQDSLAILDKYRYYACLEKHKSGVLHAHALIICDHYDVQGYLHKIKKKITTSLKLDPAINIKPVNKTHKDLERAFMYIINHKKDHPEYKQLIFNL